MFLVEYRLQGRNAAKSLAGVAGLRADPPEMAFPLPRASRQAADQLCGCVVCYHLTAHSKRTFYRALVASLEPVGGREPGNDPANCAR